MQNKKFSGEQYTEKSLMAVPRSFYINRKVLCIFL